MITELTLIHILICTYGAGFKLDSSDGFVAESSDVGEAVPVYNSHSTETCPEVLEQSVSKVCT